MRWRQDIDEKLPMPVPTARRRRSALILHSWKSFTAKEANRLIGRTGQFWQPEPYHHLIRDEDDLELKSERLRKMRQVTLGLGALDRRQIAGRGAGREDLVQRA